MHIESVTTTVSEMTFDAASSPPVNPFYRRSLEDFIDTALIGGAGRPGWFGWASAAGIVAVITIFSALVDLRVAPTNLAMLYLMGVVVISYRWGLGPALASSVVSAFTFDFFFIPPFESFAITDYWYLITALAFMCVVVLISLLTTAMRQHALLANRREAHTAALYGLAQSLAAARRPRDVIEAAAKHIRDAFNLDLVILLATGTGPLMQVEPLGSSIDGSALAEAEKVLACIRNGTDQQTGAFLPLRTAGHMIGLIMLKARNIEHRPNSGGADRLILEAIAAQVAIAINRARLEDQAREAEVLRKADEMQRTLLSSVSHSLRAPLASIISAIDPIADGEGSSAVELARIAQAEASRLDTLIGNLLDLSRLEAGALKPQLEPHDVGDVIGAALRDIHHPQGREIFLQLQPRLPLVWMDFPLIVNVLVNLLENAVKYSASESPIHIEATLNGSEVEIRVADRGCGVPLHERDAVFGKFARGSAASHMPGIGLGLPICKGFVEAHNGRIWVEDRAGGGSVFCFTLPTSSARVHDFNLSGGLSRRTAGTES